MQRKCPGIRLVIYSGEDDTHTRKILAGGSRIFPIPQMTLCRDTDAVADALKGLYSGFGIFLAVIREKGELERLASTADHLRDHAIIFVIEEGNRELTSLALKFYPRYTTGFKAEYTDIFQVLEKMITNIETKTKGDENARVRGDCRH